MPLNNVEVLRKFSYLNSFLLISSLRKLSVVFSFETNIETPCVCDWTVILLAALLKAFSHQLLLSSFLCPIPVVLNFNFGFNASVMPFSCFPKPLPISIKCKI